MIPRRVVITGTRAGKAGLESVDGVRGDAANDDGRGEGRDVANSWKRCAKRVEGRCCNGMTRQVKITWQKKQNL